MPAVTAFYSHAKPCRKTLEDFRETDHHSIAVITRTQKEAAALANKLPNVLPLRRRPEDDQQYESGGYAWSAAIT